MSGLVGDHKKNIDVEKLLQWVYRDELPKQAVGGLSGWERLIYLGTSVDISHHEAQLPVGLGPPHPDALLIDYLVRSLPENTKFNWAESAERLLGHLVSYALPDDRRLVRLRASPAALIMVFARMGTRPMWDLGRVRLMRKNGKNGKPVVEGITAGRRYSAGARCPLQLEPEAAEIMCARFEYAVWHASLMAIVNASWNLHEHIAVLPRAAAEPWITGPEPTSRILKTILPRQERLTTPAGTAC